MCPLQKFLSHDTEQMNYIVTTLFLGHPVWVDANSVKDAEDCPLFTIDEIKEAILSIKNRVPADVQNPVFYQRLDLLLGAFAACLMRGIFSVGKKWQ